MADVIIKSTPFPTMRFTWSCILATATLCTPHLSYGADVVAGDHNSIEQVMCNVIAIMTGTTGKAIATVGIIGIGTGALFGKVTWNAAMLSVLSIGLIFGSASIVGDLGGGPAFALIVGSPGLTDTGPSGSSSSGTTLTRRSPVSPAVPIDSDSDSDSVVGGATCSSPGGTGTGGDSSGSGASGSS